jgi:hypothetical protein
MERRHLAQVGAVFRSLINDLKRDDVSAAQELGVELTELREILNGERLPSESIVCRAVEIWPVNERDFLPLRDDCPAGVRIMRRHDSEASSRMLARGGHDYYEYRDTAMSRAAMFRPEWIRMLQFVDSEDPDDPRVQWNNGHLLHQFTYFVGEINYYYAWRGRRRSAAMNTGDSIWGLPFAPHSFAGRRGSERPFILALTYGAGLIGEPQQELAVLGVEAARRYALPIEDESAAVAALLRFHVANRGLTPEALAPLAGMAAPHLDAVLAGGAPAGREVRERLADALGLHPAHLEAVGADTEDGIRMVRAREVLRWDHPGSADPDYRLGRLAGSRLHPFTCGLELDVLHDGSRRSPASMETGLHQYAYCLGPGAAVLRWSHAGEEHQELVGPDDSLYLEPFVPHRLSRLEANTPVRMLALRIGGRTRIEAMAELGGMSVEGIARVVAEDRQWYDPESAAPGQGRR